MEMPAKCIMFQGTASHVGKSLLTAGLCRILKQDGFRVAPFKSQNMALNSYVTVDGLEMGRAQGVQAEAAGIIPSVDMNPILLKPKEDMVAQVIVLGKPLADMSARDYRNDYIPVALKIVSDALDRLRDAYDVIVLEGAGSPAEINLKDRDIVNMKMAEIAEAPVILIADIDRGGVFASLIGTMELLTPEERKRVAGFVINKFRGDVTLLTPGLDFLEKRTGLPVLGVIPFAGDLDIEDEDSVSLFDKKIKKGGEDLLDIVVMRLPRISNFTDFDPLAAEQDVQIRYVEGLGALGSPDALIIPGTKNTSADLLYLQNSGLAKAIKELCISGTPVVGICGGYQMLGRELLDPKETESKGVTRLEALGLLPLTTAFSPLKITRQVKACVSSHDSWGELAGLELQGYEIRHGQSEAAGTAPHIIISEGAPGEGDIIGMAATDLPVFGTYLHNIFHNDRFRRCWLDGLRARRGLPPLAENENALSTAKRRQQNYDYLAQILRSNLDMEKLYSIMGLDGKVG